MGFYLNKLSNSFRMFSKLFTGTAGKVLTGTRNNVVNTVSRSAGGGPRMMRYRGFTPTYFKMAMRYIMYGAIPSGAIILYTRFFVGPAELYDYDPECYEPEYYEFFEDPITRFFAKWVKEDPKISYYRRIGKLEKETQNYRQISIVSQARNLQQINKKGYLFMQHNPAIESGYDRVLIDQYANDHELDGNLWKPQSDANIGEDEDQSLHLDTKTMDFTVHMPSQSEVENEQSHELADADFPSTDLSSKSTGTCS